MTLELLDYILKIILSALMGGICGLTVYFIDYTFWRGAIFQFYLPFLAKHLTKLFRPKEYKNYLDLKNTMSKIDYEDSLKDEAQSIFLYKMLGGCAVCFGIWFAMVSYCIIYYLTFFEWYYFFPYVFVSSWQIRKLVGQTY